MDNKIINNIKSLALDMIDEANSGHPGIVLSAAPIIYSLFTYHLKFNPLDPTWINRDRFIMSCGHGSALLYSMLHTAGYDISLDELKRFRDIDSITPGHPEFGLTSGVEMTTGPLGQGFASSVGVSIGERHLNSLIKTSGGNNDVINYFTYVLCSDGDLMEGISYESASLAGNLGLGKLIVLYDSNDVCLDGKLNMTFSDDIQKRFSSMGWQTILVEDGNDINKINDAINIAKTTLDKPSLIELKTILGYESSVEDSNEAHGKPLSKSDLVSLKEKWGLNTEKFMIDENAFVDYRLSIKERIQNEYSRWSSIVIEEEKNSEVFKILNLLRKKEFEIPDYLDNIPHPSVGELRDYNNTVLNELANRTKLFIGGSADLSSSCKTMLNNFPSFSKDNYNGKNIWFGVREHAMGAITNGLSLSGLRPFCATFLVFADYLKPTIRLNSLMRLNGTFIFSHDSIALGQDGPTHQPIEQLSMLRSIPGCIVLRPYNFKELVGSWKWIMENNQTTCLVINKNKTEHSELGNSSEVFNGAYIISSEKESLDGIIIATGSEVKLALDIQKKLIDSGKDIRVVSMPSVELFEQKDYLYKQNILPAGIKKIVIEASNDLKFLKFVTNEKYLLNINEFGASGKKDDVLNKYGFGINEMFKKINDIFD